MQKKNRTVAVIGAGDFIGGEIAKKFASEGFTIFAGRRNGEKLAPLVKEIEAAGGEIHARSLDARKEEEIVAFVQLLKNSPATAQDLMAHVAPQLTSYKRPSEIILMDALPATSTGKLLKHKLAESLRK